MYGAGIGDEASPVACIVNGPGERPAPARTPRQVQRRATSLGLLFPLMSIFQQRTGQARPDTNIFYIRVMPFTNVGLIKHGVIPHCVIDLSAHLPIQYSEKNAPTPHSPTFTPLPPHHCSLPPRSPAASCCAPGTGHWQPFAVISRDYASKEASQNLWFTYAIGRLSQ